MKKYKFRLDTVLRVRRTEEDLAKAELARANARVAEAVEVNETKRRVRDRPAPAARSSGNAARGQNSRRRPSRTCRSLP